MKESEIVEFSAEFDNYGNPPTVGRIEIRTLGPMQTLVIVLEEEEIILLTVARDQWGTWYALMNAIKNHEGKLSHYAQSTTIAQEDETRSFMDALIKALLKIKNDNEYLNKEATIIPIT